MDNKEEQKKDINLMPEDLRSKESGVLSKVKSKHEFEYDFVSPDSSALKKSKEKSGSSFFEKIKRLFNRPAGFGEPKTVAKPEEKKPLPHKKSQQTEDKKPIIEDDFVLHMPVKEDKSKDQLRVDYKEGLSLDKKNEGQDDYKKSPSATSDFNLSQDNDNNQENKKNALSFLDKIKAWFKFGAKDSKMSKIEPVPARPIVPRPPSKEQLPTGKIDGLVDILDENSIKAIPELKTNIEQVKMDEPADLEPETKSPIIPKPTPPVPKKEDSGFSIPSLSIKEEPYKPEVAVTKEPVEPKYHEPVGRIRAKFLNDGGGVDLIPEAVKVRSWRQIIRLLGITFLSFSMVIAIFYAFLFFQGKRLENERNKNYDQITNIERQIVEYKEKNDEITRLGNQIKMTHKLISLHIYWTNFFQMLEKYTIDGVYYSGLKSGINGAMTLNASAPDYDTLAKQIKILQQEEAKEFVTSVAVPGATLNESIDSIEFGLNIVLNPSLFLYNPDYIYQSGNYEQ